MDTEKVEVMEDMEDMVEVSAEADMVYGLQAERNTLAVRATTVAVVQHTAVLQDHTTPLHQATPLHQSTNPQSTKPLSKLTLQTPTKLIYSQMKVYSDYLCLVKNYSIIHLYVLLVYSNIYYIVSF